MVSHLTMNVPPYSSYLYGTDTSPNVITHSVVRPRRDDSVQVNGLNRETLFVLASSKVQTLFRKMMAYDYVLMCALRFSEKGRYVNYCYPFINHAQVFAQELQRGGFQEWLVVLARQTHCQVA